jgi:UDP-GlcNAc:undecaprenyl-phosphate GlcNAc-1-phosphate transferase
MASPTLPLVVIFVLSAITSYFATGLVKRLAERIGAIDQPDERKLHITATPRLGGMAIILGFAFPLMLLPANRHAAELVSKNLNYLFAVLASGSLIIALGVYDDLVGSNAPKKFAVQTLAALILVGFGFKFDFISLAGYVIDLKWFGSLVTVVWIVFVINAVNFIDGMDALATIVTTTTAIFFLIIAAIRGDILTLVIMSALAGSLIGFYPWNRPPARIFMGDSGSLFIGLLLAACSVARQSKSPTFFIIGGPMLALALPVIDALIVMKQRFGGESAPIHERVTRMFNADRRHIHHILVGKYGNSKKAILSIWLVTVFFGIAAALTVSDRTRYVGYGLGIMAFVVLLAIRYRKPRGERLLEEEVVGESD